MADDAAAAKGATATELPDVSPGAGFQVFVDMANLHNKLKLLNYDDEYIMKWRMKPISRIHFAVPTNPGDQLHAFIALSAWLFQKGGIRFDKPGEVCDFIF
jgi:estrogen-related receptor beta like 1